MNDFRLAIRTLWQSRAFAATAVLTFALGIGANTAIFSVIHAVLINATPYTNASRLVSIYETGPLGPRMNVSPLNFQDWKKANTTLDRMSMFRLERFTIGNIDPPIRAIGAETSADLFPMLDAKPLLGRAFSSAEDQPAAPRTIVLSRGFWEERFGGDRKVIGKTIKLDTHLYTIVGVMRASFDFPERAEFWVPAGLFYLDRMWQIRSIHSSLGIGQLKPGVTIAQAQSNLNAIAGDLSRRYPVSNDGFSVALANLHEDTVSGVRPALLALLAGVGFVLLIACANVANLLLARGLRRKKDVAIRLALGATRARIARQLLMESVALAIAGGALGTILALWSIDFLVKLVAQVLPHAANIHVDFTVLAFTLAVALLTGIISGLAPSWQSSKADLNSALKETARSSTGGRERHRTRSALVICEIALSFVLLIGAGLMVRTFATLAAVDLGFKTDHVLTMEISLPNDKYPVDRLLRSIRQAPGVIAASTVDTLPLSPHRWQDVFVRPGEPRRTMADVSWTHMSVISPGYFETLRIPLVAGRVFDERDGEKGREGVIVDELFAKRYWPHENPIGQHIKFAFDPASEAPWVTVVGVARHIHDYGAEQDDAKDPLIEAYVPYRQEPSDGYTIAVRTTGEPGPMTATVENATRSVDRGLPISNVRTMDDWVATSLQYRRFSMLLLSIFAGIGLLLALVGIYGVMSYSVTQRLPEIGIRMALGAKRNDVVRLVLGNAVQLAAIGLAAGFVLALALSHWLNEVLYGVRSTDPLTFVSVALLLAATVFIAAYIPAYRATKVDPTAALRYE
jgi:putative ABC transport system permease protein